MKKEYTNTNSNGWDMDTSQPVDRKELNRRLEAVKNGLTSKCVCICSKNMAKSALTRKRIPPRGGNLVGRMRSTIRK